MTINQHTLAAYKALNPDDSYLQALTLDELLQHVGSRHVDYSKITFDSLPTFTATSTSCPVAIGYVVFDCLCLFLGACSLRAAYTEKAAAAMAEAVEPVINKFSKYILTIKSADSSKFEVASAVFGVISTIYSGGCLSAVLKAFIGSLEWYQGVLYGATALGTIMAAFATDGAAEIGLIVVELATAGWVISDSITCADACSY